MIIWLIGLTTEILKVTSQADFGSNPNEGTGVVFFAIRGRNVTNLVPK